MLTMFAGDVRVAHGVMLALLAEDARFTSWGMHTACAEELDLWHRIGFAAPIRKSAPALGNRR